MLKRVETLCLAKVLLVRLALPGRDLHPWANLVSFALESSFSKTETLIATLTSREPVQANWNFSSHLAR